ncbi:MULTISPECIES: hypothetical protein [unclassified Yoonia]|uniref:hypothetical protein n=1 Tax=unclassified Yoonia TaxID=2629118 RepID=UPI002AFF277C|nr:MULTISPECIES: hypothetical protein [unclassified Yoonia]
MIPIRNNDIRLSKRVIKVSSTQLVVYQRFRGELFRQTRSLKYQDTELVSVLSNVIVEMQSAESLDIVLDHSVCKLRLLERKFGAGWTISEKPSLVEIHINGLFDANELILCVDKILVDNITQILTIYKIKYGRLFYAIPTENFRYSVHSQIYYERSTSDVVKYVVVNYCTSLPRFSDETDYTSDTQPIKSTQKEQSKDSLLFGNSYDAIAAGDQSLAESGTESKVIVNTPEYQPVLSKAELDQRLQNKSLLTICILLDEGINTAIAASAYLARNVPQDSVVIEIGIWRKKLQSAMQRFTRVIDVLELSSLTMTSSDIRDIEIFLKSIKKTCNDKQLIVAIGADMLNDESTEKIIPLFNSLGNYSLLVIGQKNNLFADNMRRISQFTNNADPCNILISDIISAQELQLPTFDNVNIYSFNLSLINKQQVILAEKNNTLPQKLKELSAFIFRPCPNARKPKGEKFMKHSREDVGLVGEG